ncbi:DUF4407 domain-containing protein [Actinoallomurus purpureus]|uniref:DUF4407 domain-containing protein n=1 Tax=Actinoallomurus purpureus TaxID=478114 RepID=UPI002092789D|nr:DUF4407 domain-containing protein [Actinoallomurus purpureus]MCO6005403.1 DUF4407 domain-containing protein [Actinoallomurus purpureus]
MHVRRFLIWLSGARSEVLARCPTDRGKYEGIGSAVLITSVMAGISMTFALNTALMVALPIAIGFGLAWSLAIMSLDRWLVTSIQRHESAWKNFIPAIPRLVLALLFGLVISTPLVLQIFKPEIEVQIVQIQENQANGFRKEQVNGDVGKGITALQGQAQRLQRVISSGGDDPVDPGSDAKVVGLTKQRDAQQKTTNAQFKDWQCQLYGPCKPAGDGPLARAKETSYRRAQSDLNDLNTQIEARKRELTATDSNGRQARVDYARGTLPGVQRQLQTLQQQQQARQRAYEASNKASKGLLIRLQALDQVAKKNGTLRSAQILLFLFITAIECLPVIVKLLHTFGPPNSYEKILALEERAQVRVASEMLKKEQMRELFGDVDGDDVSRIWDSGPGSVTAEMPSEPPPSVSEPLDHAQVRPVIPRPPDTWEDRKLRSIRDTTIRGDDASFIPARPTTPDEPVPEAGELFPDDPEFLDDEHAG